MRKQILITLTFLLSFLTYCSADMTQEQSAFISNYTTIAIQEMDRTGIPASITLAQAIIETDWGRSTLAKESKNHFGIKCKATWKGATYYHKDDDLDKDGKLIKSCFRAYENIDQSFIDHSEFLMNNPRYAELFSISKTDYKKWAKGLKKCGYATSKTYAQALINTIEKYKLYQYDTAPVGNLIATAPTFVLPEGNEPNFADHIPAMETTTIETPAVYEIPEDYKRNNQKDVVIQNEMSTIEVQIPVSLPVLKEETPQEKKNEISQNITSVSIAVADNVLNSNEAILVSAAVSNIGTLQLSRAPRVSSNLRR